MGGGSWRAAVHGVAKSRTQLSDFTFMHWRRKWQPTAVFLPGESQGRGSQVGCCLWGRTESDTTEVMQQQQQCLLGSSHKNPFKRTIEVSTQEDFSLDFPDGLDGKASACTARDLGLIPGLGRSPGKGSGNPLQYFCLENSIDRGAWWATVHGLQRVRHD